MFLLKAIKENLSYDIISYNINGWYITNLTEEHMSVSHPDFKTNFETHAIKNISDVPQSALMELKATYTHVKVYGADGVLTELLINYVVETGKSVTVNRVVELINGKVKNAETTPITIDHRTSNSLTNNPVDYDGGLCATKIADDKVLVVFNSSILKSVIVRLSPDTGVGIWVGTVFAFEANTSSLIYNLSVVAIGNNRCLITADDINYTQKTYMFVISFVDMTIWLQKKTSYTTYRMFRHSATYIGRPNGAAKDCVIICYSDTNSSQKTRLCKLDIDDSGNISNIVLSGFATAYAGYNHQCVALTTGLSTNKIALTFYDTGYGDSITLVAEYNDTNGTITFGGISYSGVQADTTCTQSVVRLSDDRYIQFIVGSSSSYRYITCRLMYVSGINVSQVTSTQIDTGTRVYYFGASKDRLSDYVITHIQCDADVRVRAIKWTPSSPNTLTQMLSNYIIAGTDVMTKTIDTYKQSTEQISANCTFLLHRAANTPTNLNFKSLYHGPIYPTNHHGIAKASGTDGQTVSVSCGGYIKNMTGLITNTEYYVADDGSLSATKIVNPTKVAKALTTNLLEWYFPQS